MSTLKTLDIKVSHGWSQNTETRMTTNYPTKKSHVFSYT